MASRAVSYWRSVVSRNGASRWLTTSTAPRMKPFAPAATDVVDHHHGGKLSSGLRGEFVPICVVLGLVLLSLSIGAHTAKQQLMHSPGVRVSKKKRESFPEVEDPDRVASEADKFVNKSLLRRVAHIQDFDAVRSGTTDPTRPDPFHHPRTVETLKSVGVDPRSY